MKFRVAFAGIFVITAVWIVMSLAFGTRFVPLPSTVVGRLGELVLHDGLLLHAAASFARVSVALGVSFVVALPLGIAMGRIAVFDTLLSPASYLLFPVPKIALLPIVLVLFGLGNGAKVFVVGLVIFFQVLMSVRDGAKAIDKRYLVSFYSLGGSRFAALRYVILPAILPRLFTALRIGSGTALAVLFFAETFATRYGLGDFIMDSWMKVAYVDMYAGILALALLGLLIFAAIDLAERRLCRWQRH